MIEFMKSGLDRIPDPTEFCHYMLRRPLFLGGIIKTKMQAGLYLADKERTGFISPAANGDNKIPGLSQVLVHMGGEMMTDINPRLLHYGNSQAIDPIHRLRACRKDLEPWVKGLQEAMRHLTAAAVTGAQNQYLH